GRGIQRIAVTGSCPRTRLHHDLVPAGREFAHPRGSQRDAVFTVLHFARHGDAQRRPSRRLGYFETPRPASGAKKKPRPKSGLKYNVETGGLVPRLSRRGRRKRLRSREELYTSRYCRVMTILLSCVT